MHYETCLSQCLFHVGQCVDNVIVGALQLGILSLAITMATTFLCSIVANGTCTTEYECTMQAFPCHKLCVHGQSIRNQICRCSEYFSITMTIMMTTRD